jgi:hypothetical protein
MHSDDIITATLPKVSANTCKNTPYMFSSCNSPKPSLFVWWLQEAP